MYLRNSGLADTAYFGAEAEFFIFDNIRFDQNQHSGYYFIDAEEGRWNTGREKDNLGYRPRYKEGYFPVPPSDALHDLRSEMMLMMIQCGLNVEAHRHEPPRLMLNALVAEVRAFCGRATPSDDLTMMVIRYNGHTEVQ